MGEQNFGSYQEAMSLQKGEQVALSTAFELYNPTEIGIPPFDKGNKFAVIGEIGVQGKRLKETTTYLDIALVKVTDSNGIESMFMAGLEKDEDSGQKSLISGVQWVQLPEGVEVTIGRLNESPETNAAFVDGKRLTGIDFPPYISRSHTKAKYIGGAVVVTDESTLGTTVTGQELVNQDGMISSVPKTADEATKALKDQEEKRIAEANAPVYKALEEIQKKFAEIKKVVTEEDSLNLWKYASNWMGKRQAQERGDGNGSKTYEEEAGKAYNALSPDAKNYASDYLYNMQRKDELLRALR